MTHIDLCSRLATGKRDEEQSREREMHGVYVRCVWGFRPPPVCRRRSCSPPSNLDHTQFSGRGSEPREMHDQRRREEARRETDGASMAFSGERLRPAMLRRAVSVHVRSCLHSSYCLNAIFIVPCLLYPPCIKEKVRVWTHDGCRRRLPPPADQLPSCGPFLVVWHVY